MGRWRKSRRSKRAAAAAPDPVDTGPTGEAAEHESEGQLKDASPKLRASEGLANEGREAEVEAEEREGQGHGQVHAARDASPRGQRQAQAPESEGPSDGQRLSRSFLGPALPFCEDMTDEEAAAWAPARDELAADEHLAPLLQKAERDERGIKLIERFVKGQMHEKAGPKRTKLIVKQVSATLRWREKVDIDHVLAGKHARLVPFRDNIWPMRMCGRTREGHVVVLIRIADCNWHSPGKVSDIIAKLIFHQEVLFERIVALKAPSRQVLIMDLRSLNMAQYYRAYHAGLANIFSLWGKHYAESVETMHFLHPSFAFRTVFKAVKGWVEPDTLLKLNVHNTSVKVAMEEFKARGYPVESFPEYLGGDGSCVDVLSDNIVRAMEASDGGSTLDIEALHEEDLQAHGFATSEASETSGGRAVAVAVVAGATVSALRGEAGSEEVGNGVGFVDDDQSTMVDSDEEVDDISFVSLHFRATALGQSPVLDLMQAAKAKLIQAFAALQGTRTPNLSM